MLFSVNGATLQYPTSQNITILAVLINLDVIQWLAGCGAACYGRSHWLRSWQLQMHVSERHNWWPCLDRLGSSWIIWWEGSKKVDRFRMCDAWACDAFKNVGSQTALNFTCYHICLHLSQEHTPLTGQQCVEEPVHERISGPWVLGVPRLFWEDGWQMLHMFIHASHMLQTPLVDYKTFGGGFAMWLESTNHTNHRCRDNMLWALEAPDFDHRISLTIPDPKFWWCPMSILSI